MKIGDLVKFKFFHNETQQIGIIVKFDIITGCSSPCYWVFWANNEYSYVFKNEIEVI